MAVPGKKAAKKLLSCSISTSSDEDFKLFCLPCDREGPRLPAHGYCSDCKEHLCETCFNYHKKATPSRYHVLLDKTSMPQTLSFSTAPINAVIPDDLTTPCQNHKREMIKFYCSDHDSLHCSVCVTLKHNTCQVTYIPDMSGQTVDGTDFQNIVKNMDDIMCICQKISEDKRNHTSKSNRSLTDALTDVRKFRKDINQKMYELEKDIENTTKAIKITNEKDLNEIEETCDSVIKCLKTSSNFLKQLNEAKRADKLFMELKNAEQVIKDQERTVSNISKDADVKEYYFAPTKVLQTILEKEISLGAVLNRTEQQTDHSRPAELHLGTPSHQGKICVKTKLDKNTCLITGMALVTPNCLTIVDSGNRCIKMVNTHTNLVTAKLGLDSQPWDISAVKSNEAVVTLPDKQTIVFISISPNRLSEERFLKVDGQCYGISCCKGNIVVTFELPEKLQILDMMGTVLRMVTTDSVGKNIFHGPEYVVTSNKSIYVSDMTKRAIIRLNWQGDVIGYYRNMGRPRVVTMCENGSLFVCDSGADRCNVQCISEDCSVGNAVLKTLNDPWATCWCAENMKLYISSHTFDGKYDDFLNIYKIA